MVAELDVLAKQGATVNSLARWGDCGATVETRDVYSGKYDV